MYGCEVRRVFLTDLNDWVVIFGYVGALWKIKESLTSIEENKRCGIF